MMVPSASNLLGKSGTSVVGFFPGVNWVASIRAYIFLDITALFTVDCGHEIYLSAWAKWVRSARKLKKLGHGSRLGGFATSSLTVSYSKMEPIIYVMALIIRLLLTKKLLECKDMIYPFSGRDNSIDRRMFLRNLAVLEEYNNCQMLNSGIHTHMTLRCC